MVEDRRVLEEEETGSSAAFVPLETIVGTADADVLEGTAEDDLIAGRGGDDTVTGGAGADELHGGGGADRVFGQGGNDEIRGGLGNDELHGGSEADQVLGEDGNDAIFAGIGDDVAVGAAGDDAIFGSTGNDELHGGSGRDRLAGEDGNDQLLGGIGNDIITGGDGDDVAAASEGNDRVATGEGADTITGGKGADVLKGGPGEDVIQGGRGNDELRGGSNDDILNGSFGFDRLTGGGGADTFRINTMDGTTDLIRDFDEAVDILDVSDILNFEAGDDVNDFVQFGEVEAGTEVRVDPDGGREFTTIAGLEGVTITSLSEAQLGLSGGGGGGGGGGPVDEITVASANAAGQIGDGTSFLPSLSTNGGLVTFSSSAINLTDADPNGTVFDIYQKNLSSGAVTRITELDVVGGVDGDSFESSIAGNGSVVAFDSEADNIGGTDSATRDVFVQTGDAIELVSIDGNTFATGPSVSDDGSLVAFEATATGLAESGTPAGPETIVRRVYVRDLDTGELTEASTASSDPSTFADAASSDPDMAAGGGFVAFESEATNLSGADADAFSDVYVKNLSDGSISLASADESGTTGFGDSENASISSNGRFVAFQSDAQFAAADFAGGTADIYVKDLQDGSVQLVSVNGDGDIGDGESFTPSISDDGRFVAFRSDATNLVAGDDNGQADIFVADLNSPGTFLRFEMGSDTSAALESLVKPEISGDGGTVAYLTDVTVGAGGGLDAAQVTVAPVEFDSAPAALSLADVLSDGGGAGPAGGAIDGGSAPALESLLAPADVV